MRIILTFVGLLMLLCGLLWAGQGSGFVNWPANSFMVDQRPWILRGVILAIAGLAVIWYSRRRRRI